MEKVESSLEGDIVFPCQKYSEEFCSIRIAKEATED